jgi:hypothetical protein
MPVPSCPTRGLPITLACMLLAIVSSPAGQTGPLAALRVDPPRVTLCGTDARQSLLVTGVAPNGRRLDLTRQARVSSSEARVVRLEQTVLVPVSDGSAIVTVVAGGRTLRVPVQVRDTHRPREFSFVNDITPILSKSGCNSGGCHGKASGQNGFKLSVFGYDPDFDYAALVQEGRGRRIVRGIPRHSLLLLKPTLSIPHGGGRRFSVGSPEYRTLLRWIEAGTPFGRPDAPHLSRIEVLPKEQVLSPRQEQQVQVTAVYSDGSRRDATEAADFSSNAENVATADETGLIRSGGAPGDAAVMVRYMGAVGVSRIVVPRPGPALPGAAYAGLMAGSFIDRLTATRLRRLGIAPSAPADDATFLRRVSLDLTGTLPTPAEARAFLRERRPDRRQRLVDALLERPEYAEYWALRWADVLRVDREALGSKGAFVFQRWLREQMARNTSYDRWVHELLVAQGDTAEVGPANLYRAVRSPEDAANTVSQVFMGVRLQCAQCHHHPFEKWSQEDFWGIAGFFARLQRKSLTGDSERLYSGGTDEAHHPRTGAIIQAHLLESSPQAPRAQPDDRRETLARWLTSSHNRFFARMLANRLWAHLLGRGLVEPVDDLRDTNPAANTPLLDALAAFAVRSGFDQKAILREIANCSIYQLSPNSNRTNAQDEQNFSRARVKSVPAEVLLDAICSATEVPEKFEGVPEGMRALDLWDNRLTSYFLDLFGRPLRGSPCECERSQEPSMTQALHLLNSPNIQAKLSSRRGRVARLLRAGETPDAIIEELYLATLSRPPTPGERGAALDLFHRSASRKAAAEDLLWALMNSYAFVFNR